MDHHKCIDIFKVLLRHIVILEYIIELIVKQMIYVTTFVFIPVPIILHLHTL